MLIPFGALSNPRSAVPATTATGQSHRHTPFAAQSLFRCRLEYKSRSEKPVWDGHRIRLLSCTRYSTARETTKSSPPSRPSWCISNAEDREEKEDSITHAADHPTPTPMPVQKHTLSKDAHTHFQNRSPVQSPSSSAPCEYRSSMAFISAGGADSSVARIVIRYICTGSD